MDNGAVLKITEKKSSQQLIRDAYRLMEGNPFKLVFFPFLLILLFFYGYCFITMALLASDSFQLIYVGLSIALLSYLVIGIAINLMQKREHWFFRDTMKLIVSFFKPITLIGTVLFVVIVWCLGQPVILNIEVSGVVLGRVIGVVLLFFCLYCYSLLIYKERGNFLALRSVSNFFYLLTKSFSSFVGITIFAFVLVALIISVNYFADPLIEHGQTWFDLLLNPKHLSPVRSPSLLNLFINGFLIFYVFDLAIIAMTYLWEENRPAEETPELDSEEEIKADFKDKINQALFGNEDKEE